MTPGDQWAAIYGMRTDRLERVNVGEALFRLRGRLVYLASPYTKRAEWDGRFDLPGANRAALDAARWSATFAAAGVTAISPIVLAHEACIADHMASLDPLDGTFWAGWCAPLLAACPDVIIPPIDGWDQSEGILHEVRVKLTSGGRVFLLGDG